MSNVPTLSVTRRWECPSCGQRHETTETKPHVPMHECSAQRGMTVPFVSVDNYGDLGRQVRHVVVEREDQISGEKGLHFDGEGRPIMAVRTERADGSNDIHVFPGFASGVGKSREQA